MAAIVLQRNLRDGSAEAEFTEAKSRAGAEREFREVGNSRGKILAFLPLKGAEGEAIAAVLRLGVRYFADGPTFDGAILRFIARSFAAGRRSS